MKIFSRLILASLLLLPTSYTRQGVAAKNDGKTASVEHEVPSSLYPVLRVADGDTITVMMSGKKEKIRLLNVDTEEAGKPGASTKPSKPNTIFGAECKAWAIDYFSGPRSQVGLWYPDKPSRGTFGRLLAHVVLPDGTDFNLLLVRTGKSPYFNKYGNSLKFDAAFRKAQELAQKEQLGIWDPATNSGGAKRPYKELLPWWEARATAVELFRSRTASDPETYFDASSQADLERAAAMSADGTIVTIFGLPQSIFIEDNGSRTILFRNESRNGALRVKIPAAGYDEHRAAGLLNIVEEYHQNYVWVAGLVKSSPQGFSLHATSKAQWWTEPQYPVSEP